MRGFHNASLAMVLGAASLGMNPQSSASYACARREINHLPLVPKPLTKRQRRRLRDNAKGASHV